MDKAGKTHSSIADKNILLKPGPFSPNNKSFFNSIHPKLNVTAIDHASEHEANQVAVGILGGSNQAIQQKSFFSPVISISRKGSANNSKHEEKSVNRKHENDNTISENNQATSYITNLEYSGSTLSGEVRSFFEPRFGQDLSTVKIHTGTEAARSASDMNAEAYVVGNHIVFGSNNYQPDTERGKIILAHELTHTIQNSGHSHGLSNDNPSQQPAVARMTETQIRLIATALADQVRAWIREVRPGLIWGGNSSNYAIAEVFNTAGELVDRSTGTFIIGGSTYIHAENEALRLLDSNLNVRGGDLFVVTSQLPCADPTLRSSDQNCELRVVEYARRRGLNLHVGATVDPNNPGRSARQGSGTGVTLLTLHPTGALLPDNARRPREAVPRSLNQRLNPAALDEYLLDYEIYAILRYAEDNPALAATNSQLRQALEDLRAESLRRNRSHAFAARLQPDHHPWNGIQLHPIARPSLPQNLFTSIREEGQFFREMYRFIPRIRNFDAPMAVYYEAFNTSTRRTEYAIGPEQLDNFLQSTRLYANWADAFWDSLQRPAILASNQFLDLLQRGDLRGALHMLGVAHLAALHDPVIIRQTVMAVAGGLGRSPVAAEASTGVRVNVGSGATTGSGAAAEVVEEVVTVPAGSNITGRR